MVICLCQICGEKFRTTFSRILRGNGKFCSWNCYSKYRKTFTGEKNPNFGKTHTLDTRLQISEGLKKYYSDKPGTRYGVSPSEETRKKISASNKGRVLSEETRRRQSVSLKMTLSNPEKRRSMSAAAKKSIRRPEVLKKYCDAARKRCQDPKERQRLSEINKGRVFSEMHRENLSKSEKGEKNHQWLGGISFEPYCVKFTKEFKERVRAFFDYRCVECGKTQEENGKRLHIHHVNFDKQSCCNDVIPLFVALCTSCHMKTNHNRVFWEYWFTEMINRLYGGKCYFTKEEMTVYG